MDRRLSDQSQIAEFTAVAQWQAVLRAVDGVKDALGKGIDPGIRETVAVLTLLGFDTRQSCEGHVNAHGYGLPSPWVEVATITPADGAATPEARMRRLLDAFYQDRNVLEEVRIRWDIDRIQAGGSYEQLDAVRRQLKDGILTEHDRQRLVAVLADRQREMCAFTAFLMAEAFSGGVTLFGQSTESVYTHVDKCRPIRNASRQFKTFIELPKN